MERSVCEGLIGRLNQAAYTADIVAAETGHTNYPLLALRSLSLLASWHTQEGRFAQSWKTNQDGLASFWKGAFPAERGFQLYSDMELTSEQAELWYLAYLLQREVLTMINETERLDFQATAHLHLATAAAASGAVHEAQREFTNADALFKALPQTEATRFLEADNRIGAVQLEVEQGHTSAARAQLEEIGQGISSSTSFTVQVRYNRAWAAFERGLSNTKEEMRYLQRVISIGNQGYRTLASEHDRWEWTHEVGSSYRRLLELEMEQPHSPDEALADWELFKFRQSTGGRGFTGAAIANPTAREFLLTRAQHLHDSTLITFAVFPRWTLVWTLDDRGISEKRIAITAKDMERLVQRFYFLCSNPESDLQKVKREGQRLYRVLIGPVSPNLDGRVLLIEPDDLLSVLPWSALTTEAGAYFGEKQPMIQTPGLFYEWPKPIQSETSGSILLTYPGAVTIDGRLYPDLPAGRQEVEYIRSKYSNVIYLHDTEVTADNLLEVLPSTSIFHFVGHAVSNEYGGELVVQGKNGGELLSSSTVRRLDLNRTELVVLSACSTATASGESARDPNGLVRTFLRSGAKQVLASQWEVSSASTAMFMENFHSLLAAGSNTAEALSESRSDLIRTPKNSHPYYWASFELFGTQSHLSN